MPSLNPIEMDNPSSQLAHYSVFTNTSHHSAMDDLSTGTDSDYANSYVER